MKYIEEILPCLITMLDFNDKQIKADTCWAFSYITDGPNERIQYVLDVSLLVNFSTVTDPLYLSRVLCLKLWNCYTKVPML